MSRSNFGRIIEFTWERMQREYDRVIGIAGAEGRGKSRGIFLHLIEEYYAARGVPVPSGRYGVHVSGFKKALLTAEKYDFCGLDEGGDTLNKIDQGNTFAKMLYKTMTVVREKLYFTTIVMPSFFDFPKGIRERRMHGLFHAHRRVDNRCKACDNKFTGPTCKKCGSSDYTPGYVVWRYFNRKNLNYIVAWNRYAKIPTLYPPGVEFIEGRNSEYKGQLLKEYTAMKGEKMDAVIDQLAREMETLEQEENEKKCPNCGSRDFRYTKKLYKCRACPMRWAPSKAELRRIKKMGGRTDVK